MEKQMSSIWRELRAVALVLDSLAEELKGGTCVHKSDNQAAVHIIQVGSRKPHCNSKRMK